MLSLASQKCALFLETENQFFLNENIYMIRLISVLTGQPLHLNHFVPAVGPTGLQATALWKDSSTISHRFEAHFMHL